jgi:hypothetical protein
VNRRRLLSSALAAVGAALMPWRKRKPKPDAVQPQTREQVLEGNAE